MQININPRAYGKTSQIIRLAAETGGHIISLTRKASERIVKKAKEMGYTTSAIKVWGVHKDSSERIYSPERKPVYAVQINQSPSEAISSES